MWPSNWEQALTSTNCCDRKRRVFRCYERRQSILRTGPSTEIWCLVDEFEITFRCKEQSPSEKDQFSYERIWTKKACYGQAKFDENLAAFWLSSVCCWVRSPQVERQTKKNMCHQLTCKCLEARTCLTGLNTKAIGVCFNDWARLKETLK